MTASSRPGSDDDAIAVLAGSRLLDNVRILSLRSNAITDKGARLLAKSPHTRNLLQLNLNNNEVTAAGKQALVRGLETARILA